MSDKKGLLNVYLGRGWPLEWSGLKTHLFSNMLRWYDSGISSV